VPLFTRRFAKPGRSVPHTPVLRRVWVSAALVVGLGCSAGTSKDGFSTAASLGGESTEGGSLGTIGGAIDPNADATFGDGTGEDTGAPNTTGPVNPNEMCNGLDDDDNGAIDDGLGTLQCGMGMCAVSVPACSNGMPGNCVPLPGSEEVCNGLDDDCDGTTDEDTESDCSTACGRGVETCVGGALTCDAPQPQAESCNYEDDNCDGSTDENVAGCRVGVHRAYNGATVDHLYTTDLAEANAGGFGLQTQNYFDVYAASHPGLVAFYRCLKTNGKRFFTQSMACEGPPVLEGVLGYISADNVAGTTALYRLYYPPTGSHFYTTSAAERDAAVANSGYSYESIAGYVF